jgi:hypothetical protein
MKMVFVHKRQQRVPPVRCLALPVNLPMATGNNPSIQPALEASVPGPALSISTGAPPFQVGECILVRIPVPLQIDERLLDLDPETLTSGIPPTSMKKSPHRIHICGRNRYQWTAPHSLSNNFFVQGRIP